MSPQDTRQAIMGTAQGFIQRRGANSVSYQHISDEVGTNKASIHDHFPTGPGAAPRLRGESACLSP